MIKEYLPEQYSIERHLWEVYKTDEENFEPYVPNGGETEETTTEEEDTSEEEEETTEEEEEEDEEETEGFKLHQGEILEIQYYNNLNSMEFSMDYEDISSSGNITLPYTYTDLNYVYLGVRTLLRMGWESYGETQELKDLNEAHLAFITEETFSDDMTKLTMAGMTKLLDVKYQFSFTQMLRSKIIEEVIKTAGLKAEVDPTGLDDQVIDYTNVSSDSSDDTGSGDTSGVDGDVVKLAKQVCSGKKGARNKANAICGWISANIPYPHPNYSNHQRCPSQVLKDRLSNCCDRARLGYQMGKVVGLTGRGVHGPGHVWVQYQIDGQWIDSDPSESRTSIGSTWKGMSMDRLWEFPEC